MNQTHHISRRTFLGQSFFAAAVCVSAAPTLLSASAAAKRGAAPNEQVRLGCIGTGSRGQDVLRHFLNQPDCRVQAVCDVEKNHLGAAKTLVDQKYGNQDCVPFHDFRELLARPDIDAVLIASTDHWHVPHALAAVRAGKDVYVEKPLGLTLAEDQLLRKEVIKRRRVFQFGTQQRSDRKFRIACELVRNGYIGQLKHINIWAPGSNSGGSTKQVPPPATLDYDFWLGPAKHRPYTENLTSNSTWWFVSDFALGFIAGWGIHPMDIALWGAGPLAQDKVRVGGAGVFPTEGVCDTATTWDVDFQFNSGLTMKFAGVGGGQFPHEKEWRDRYGEIDSHGTAFEGTEGWIHVNRSRLAVHPESLIDISPDTFKTRLAFSSDHVKDFLKAVRSRKPTVSTIESAVLSDAFCHVPNIALRLGRDVVYDAKSEKFVHDKEANARLKLRALRKPWRF